MNFWVIFLCLLFGAVIGFEFGKYTESRRIREAMKSLSEGMKEAAEKMQKFAEKEREQKEQNGGYLQKLGIVGFDTRYYKTDKTVPAINRKEEMDRCSKLMTAMVTKGATDSEVGRVVRYSMVAIDAEKLGLDWVTAKKDEGVDLLMEKYMGANKEGIQDGEGA